ncbi:MAG: helix-turn-helix transcriptional regulator [Pseudomonadales bacterium]|nr:helix-turn-helix transcriptional regulator [Pseudomonadales bacterium]
MKQTSTQAYSRYSADAVQLMSSLIKVARKERKLTTQDIADRAGISRGLVQRIEKGDMKCSIGAVFEVAAILNIKLFDADKRSLSTHIRQNEDKLSLMPKSIRKKTRVIKDDF